MDGLKSINSRKSITGYEAKKRDLQEKILFRAYFLLIAINGLQRSDAVVETCCPFTIEQTPRVASAVCNTEEHIHPSHPECGASHSQLWGSESQG